MAQFVSEMCERLHEPFRLDQCTKSFEQRNFLSIDHFEDMRHQSTHIENLSINFLPHVKIYSTKPAALTRSIYTMPKYRVSIVACLHAPVTGI